MSRRRPVLPEHALWHHWRAATNVLLLHGSEAGRDKVARGVHLASPVPLGPYLKLNCRLEEEAFQVAVRKWISEDGRGAEPAALMGDGYGTLFLDGVEALSDESQGLLYLLLERLAESTALGQSRPVGRLIAGSQVNLHSHVLAGHFRPELYDALNKARVVLRGGRRSRSRMRSHDER